MLIGLPRHCMGDGSVVRQPSRSAEQPGTERV